MSLHNGFICQPHWTPWPWATGWPPLPFTEKDACRQEVKKLGLKHQFPVRHDPEVLAVELRQNGEVFSPSVQWPHWCSPGGVTDSDCPLCKTRFSSSLGACEHKDGATTHQTECLLDPQTAVKDLGCKAASDSHMQTQFWNGNCKWGRAWARWGEKTGRETTKGGTRTNTVKSHWRSTSKAGKQLHYSPPDITNLESNPETMQWSNAYKNVCTWNKSLEGSIPSGRYHGIFCALYKLPQLFQEYMLCIHCPHQAQPDLAPLNYLLTNFRVYLPFLHCFSPYDSLPSFAEYWWEAQARQGLVLIEWALCVCICKMYSSVLSPCPTSRLAEPGLAHSPCSGSPRVSETLSQINMQKLLF